MISQLLNQLVNEEIRVSTAITKCGFILDKVEDTELADFIRNESKGYDGQLPTYRILPAKIEIRFCKPGRRKDIVMPISDIPSYGFSSEKINEVKYFLENCFVVQSVRYLENVLMEEISTRVVQFIPSDIVMEGLKMGCRYGDGCYEFRLSEAWYVVAKPDVQNIIDQTRIMLIEILKRIRNMNPTLDEYFKEFESSSNFTFITQIGDVHSSNVAIGKGNVQKENTIN